MTRSRAALGIALTLGLAAALIASRPRGAAAQAPCARQCAAELRDANGCCPGNASPPPPRPDAPSTPSVRPGDCPAGQSRTVDTSGHCCWPGQVWADRCIGTPTSCVPGYVATATGCEVPQCTDGRRRMPDGLHCCWPGQAWSATRSVCVGIPQCPAGIAVFGETCAVPQPPAPMIQLGGGAFVMQAPPRTVMVQPFAIDLTEVTVDAYTACVAHGGCSASNVSVSGDGSDARWNAFCNYGKPGKGNHPMNCVDWNQAAAYCQSQVPAKRLPTEAEWEWAARGGPEGRAFPWGGAPPGSQLCWARSTAGTCPVGSFPAGDAPGGIHDMAGNVFEWTASMNNALTPTHAESGGGWAGTYAPSVRAVTGTRMPSTSRYSDLGFRCVR